MASLNRISLTNGYTEASTLRLAGIRRINIQVFNFPIAYQLAFDLNGFQFDPLEHVLDPVYASLSSFGICSGIRLRNYQVGNIAVVTVDAY